MIRRGERPQANFTILSNELLRDDRLSYRARGVLASILSRPDNWRVSRDALAREGKEGRDAVGTAINELIEVGYAVRQKHQGENGKWVTEIVVFDQPTTENPSSVTGDSGFSGTGDWKTDDWKTDAGFSVANTSTVTKNCEEETHSPSSTSSTDGFDEFWSQYPRKVGKGEARKRWGKMNAKARASALAAVSAHAESWAQAGTESQFIPHPATWLNREQWDDELTPARPAKAKGILAQMDDFFAEHKAELEEQLTASRERGALNSPVLELPTETGDTP